jgi:hypothetical protein
MASRNPPGPSAVWVDLRTVSLRRNTLSQISIILKKLRLSGWIAEIDDDIRRCNERKINSYGFVNFLASSQTPSVVIRSMSFFRDNNLSWSGV